MHGTNGSPPKDGSTNKRVALYILTLETISVYFNHCKKTWFWVIFTAFSQGKRRNIFLPIQSCWTITKHTAEFVNTPIQVKDGVHTPIPGIVPAESGQGWNPMYSWFLSVCERSWGYRLDTQRKRENKSEKEMERNLIQLFTTEQLVFVLSAMLTVAMHTAIQKTTCSYGKLEECHQCKQPLFVQNFADKCFSNSSFTHPLFPRSHLQVRVKIRGFGVPITLFWCVTSKRASKNRVMETQLIRDRVGEKKQAWPEEVF